MNKIIDRTRTLKKINSIMNDKGVTASDVNKETGINIRTIQKWVDGEAFPTLQNLVALSQVLETRIDDLLEADPEALEALYPVATK